MSPHVDPDSGRIHYGGKDVAEEERLARVRSQRWLMARRWITWGLLLPVGLISIVVAFLASL